MSHERFASLAPARIGARKSVSLSENRQVRSLPSAVSRMRSQSEQNGSETGLMKPIRPAPSAKRQDAMAAFVENLHVEGIFEVIDEVQP